MKLRDIRRWVDKAGAADVAQACGVSVATACRWAATGKIPKTREPKVDEEYAKWAAIRASRGGDDERK